MNVLKGSWPLKLLALVSAILTYTYITVEIRGKEKENKTPDLSYRLIKLTAKDLPVKPRLATAPPEGCRILSDQVSAEPSRVIVIGPEALLEEASVAETALIDISENTKTTTKLIPLESVAGIHLNGSPYMVSVTVPLEKIEAPAPAPVPVSDTPNPS